MKIFVVGGAGYIGSVCSELLLDEGHDVVIFDNLSEGHRAAVDSRTHFIEAELAGSPADSGCPFQSSPGRRDAFRRQRAGG